MILEKPAWVKHEKQGGFLERRGNTRTHKHTNTHAHTHTHTQKHTHKHTHTNTHTNKETHKHTHTHATHTRTHRHTHAYRLHTHTQKHTDTQIHTHTNTHVLRSGWEQPRDFGLWGPSTKLLNKVLDAMSPSGREYWEAENSYFEKVTGISGGCG